MLTISGLTYRVGGRHGRALFNEANAQIPEGSKLGLVGRNVLLNVTVRATRANQLGLLGFGGDKNDDYQVMGEVSAGVFLHDRVLLGVEYRQKPDNLSAFREQDFYDVFVAFLPAKRASITVAYAQFGQIADKQDQEALYLSLQLSF